MNNAGVCDTGTFEEQTLDDLRLVVEVNLIAVIDLSRMASELLQAVHGCVINVSSIYGLVGSRGPMPGYNASKAGLST